MWDALKAANPGLVDFSDIKRAFYAKYPNGTISKGFMYSYNVKVQFTPGGKNYFYYVHGYELMKKLGIAS